MTASSGKIKEFRPAGRHAKRNEALAALLVLAAAACLFGFLFNRETALSYSIGYNLYGAERVLAGEVPYRDFHTLYPPATVYLNAALLKVFGVRLYVALFGVFVFKALTTMMIYLGGRLVLPRSWAIIAVLYSVVWLRPNGPFKAVPMHYGALMLASALYWMLRYQKSGRLHSIVAAGVSVGLLALFKHNIGAYALAGFSACLLLGAVGLSAPEDQAGRVAGTSRGLAGVAAMLLGFAAAVLPVLVYLETRSAIGAMVRSLLFGPGEFLVSRLAAAPSPLLPALCLLGLAGFAYAVYSLRSKPGAAGGVALVGIIAVAAFCIAGGESSVSEVLFYAPLLVLASGVGTLIYGKKLGEYARPIGPLLIAAAAAFMESFPRFAREQVIAAMPFVGLLLIYLIYGLWRISSTQMAARKQLALVMALLPLAFFLLGLRFFHQTFFRGGLTLKSDTELGTDRGRGVYFPAETAREIDDVTRYVQQKTPKGGYVFPQSYAGSSFLFLADRKNPSPAQFWSGVGVGAAERASTLDALDQKQPTMIITSAADLAAEKYEPMRDYIAQHFKQTAQFGGVIILERNE